MGGDDSVFHAQWPECDEEAMKDDEIEVAVQINGRHGPLSASAQTAPRCHCRDEEAGKTDGQCGEIYVPERLSILYVNKSDFPI